MFVVNQYFFKINFYQKIFQEHFQNAKWFGFRSDRINVLSVLIWVQIVCKGYQQTTKVSACKERGKKYAGDKIACKITQYAELIKIVFNRQQLPYAGILFRMWPIYWLKKLNWLDTPRFQDFTMVMISKSCVGFWWSTEFQSLSADKMLSKVRSNIIPDNVTI